MFGSECDFSMLFPIDHHNVHPIEEAFHMEIDLVDPEAIPTIRNYFETLNNRLSTVFER